MSEISCPRYAALVSEIFNSVYFNPAEILSSPLSFSQAYCLLWQDSTTGGIKGRTWCEALQAGLTAALVLDLCARERLLVSNRAAKVLGLSWERPTAVLVDRKLTDSYLDAALLNKILDRAKKNDLRHWALADLIEACLNGDAAKVVLNDLAKLGVVSESKGFCGMMKYPTLDPKPIATLKSSLRDVLLNHAPPTAFVACLLTLLSATEANLYLWYPRLVKPCFSSEEYPTARAALEALAQQTRTAGRGEEKDLLLVLTDSQL